jgi:hypothetical protein
MAWAPGSPHLALSAHALVPHIASSVLPGATHHTIPAGPPGELNRRLTAFLA